MTAGVRIVSALKFVALIGLVFLAGMLFARWQDSLTVTYAFHGAEPESRARSQDVEPRISFDAVPTTASVLEKRRALLRDRIFGKGDAPAPAQLEQISAEKLVSSFIGPEAYEKHYKALFEAREISVEQISGRFTEIEGFKWKSLLIRSQKASNGKLVLYHHGHDGSPFTFRWTNEFLSQLIAEGYDLLVMSMPGIGWNRIENVRIRTWDGWGFLTGRFENEHRLFELIDTGDAHFIKYFVGPVVSSIDRVLATGRYQSIVMIGHSGGGWTTTVSAALDDRIGASIAYGGSLPFFARRSYLDFGDAEQSDPAFYREFSYPLLYELASSSADGGRVHYLFYNDKDNCCFNEDSTKAFLDYYARREASPLRDLRVAIIRGKTHHIVPEPVLEVLRTIEPRALIAERRARR